MIVFVFKYVLKLYFSKNHNKIMFFNVFFYLMYCYQI
jgi:hypothetical protein